MTTDASDDLRAEVERLRAEVEAHRQRELAELKAALADAVGRANAWEQEARRISQQAIIANAEHDATVAHLKDQLAAARQVRGVRATSAN